MPSGKNSSSHYLLCNGATFNSATYPDLNTFLGGNTLPNYSSVND